MIFLKNSKLVENELVLASVFAQHPWALFFLKNIFLFDFMKIKIGIRKNP
jgi:hypothetical protein